MGSSFNGQWPSMNAQYGAWPQYALPAPRSFSPPLPVTNYASAARWPSRVGCNSSDALDQMIVNSQETDPDCLDPLEPDLLRNLHQEICCLIMQTSGQDLALTISNHVIRCLDKHLLRDKANSRGPNRRSGAANSRQIFRAMAEISQYLPEARVGIRIALAHFLSNNVDYIARYESYIALGQWCVASYNADIERDVLIDCFRRIMREVPTLPEDLSGHGARARQIADVLDDVQQKFMETWELEDHRDRSAARDVLLHSNRASSPLRGASRLRIDRRTAAQCDDNQLLLPDTMPIDLAPRRRRDDRWSPRRNSMSRLRHNNSILPTYHNHVKV